MINLYWVDLWAKIHVISTVLAAIFVLITVVICLFIIIINRK